MSKRYILLILFLLSAKLFLSANPVRIDSILEVLSKKQPDTSRIRTLIEAVNFYYKHGDIQQATMYCKEAVDLSEKDKSPYFLAFAYYNMGGAICNGTGDFTNALDYLLKAYPISEKTNDKKLTYSISNALGNTYLAKKNLDKAYEYYYKAFIIASDLKDTLGIGITLTGLGNVLSNQKKYDLAINYFLKATDSFIKVGRLDMYNVVYPNIASIYLDQKEPAKALFHLNKVIKQIEKEDNKYALGNAYLLYGQIYTEMGRFDDALVGCYKSMAIFKKSLAKYDLSGIYVKIAEVYNKMNKNDSAYHYMRLYTEIKDSIYSAENSTLVTEMQEKYESEKKEKENKLLLSQNELAESRIKQQNRLQIGLLLFLIMAFAFSFFLYRSNKQKQKNNQIILMQKEETEKQRALLQLKNTEVLDSINYAKRLQEAILPPLRAIKRYFPESFLIYKPKDIVAGDFYWMEQLGRDSAATLNTRVPGKEQLLLAVADCTGHGVPGAIVSVVCSNALNRTVKELGVTEPGKILDKVRELVVKTFVREDSESEVKDGMDISLISLEHNVEDDTYTVKWAGANNPLWIMRRNKNKSESNAESVSFSDFELDEIKADKQAIGKVDLPRPYVTHTLSLNKGDRIYLFTDGYADQFGGPDGKKFKYKQLKELLLANAGKPMKEQGTVLNTAFTNWMGSLEQVDDILILGIAI